MELTYIRAVNAALGWALRELPDTVVLGEDVAIPGGPFGATKGLRDEFGARVFDTPISESAMVGTALGMALDGMRPVVEVMYGDFLLVAMDQIVNQVANTHYVSNGQLRAPLVIRTQHGSTPGSCAQHSQSLEALFAHVPGLRVGLPATPDDAYQMLRAALVSDDPVLIMESRRLYPLKGEVDVDADVQAVGAARVVRPGRDVTIVTWGTLVAPCLEAAGVLAGDGIETEVVDLRWAAPIDAVTVAASASRTGRLVVVHEANRTGGLGAEVVAEAAERVGTRLRTIRRVATRDVRMPASPALSRAVLPSTETVVDAVREALTPTSASSS
ncbi:MAG TPA: transketolase C-terminal domain-containing protein [Nocardioides sp.]|jgi:pyruvate/2-oxoglutarate/acetoin dehydrogenase E1 component|nr:transketolase C-terminal domain-containing protein [Nocardioides sp.]